MLKQVEFNRQIQIQIWTRGGGLNPGKMTPVCQLCGKKAQHRNNVGYSCSPHSKATGLIFFPYVSGASQAPVSLSKLSMHTCE